MRAIRSKDTRPEMCVRELLRVLGYPGYRLHRKDLPGNPDIAFIARKKVIFVHGCFWHGHSCKVGERHPKVNQDYWLPKIARTRLRDMKASAELATLGWHVLTLWECEMKDVPKLTAVLKTFMQQSQPLPVPEMG